MAGDRHGAAKNDQVAVRRPLMAELPRAIGPVQEDHGWAFLCPACDAGRADAQDVQEVDQRCTVVSLQGQLLEFSGRSCHAWESDPFEGEDASDKEKRFFFYSSIARLLGGAGRRVDLPTCVKLQISKLYGPSQTGFRPN